MAHYSEQTSSDTSPTFEEYQRKEQDMDAKAFEKLQRDMRAMERENLQLKRGYDQLQGENQQLKRGIARRDHRIEHLEEENEEKGQEIKHYKDNNSIAGVWDNNGNNNFEIQKWGGTVSTCHVDRKKEKASSEQADFFSLVSPGVDEETLKKSSSLLAAFDQVTVDHGPRVNEFGNESDVQGYVHCALMDAVKIVNGLAGGKKLLMARRESGIFSNRPDHMVVGIGSLHTPILIVETKQPETNHPVTQPETNQPVAQIEPKVLGQIYDYLGIMRVVGHPNPFVVLSTFEQSWMTWEFSDKKCHEIVSTTNTELRIKQPLKQLQYHSSRHTISGTPSPCKLSAPHDAAPTRSKKEPTKRKLWISIPYQSKDLVKLLVNALLCSLSNFDGTPAILRNDQGYALTNKPVMTLLKDSYKFETISRQVVPGEFESFNFAKRANKGFHIMDVLGSGRTSKVFLATTTTGKECVLKMYVRKFDEGMNYKPIEKDEFEVDATDSTRREKEMYERIYGMKISIITLYNHMCLVLPYVCPVPKDEREEVLQTHLPNLLRKVFRVTQGRRTIYYKFKKDDHTWHHCGYLNGTFFLLDLADLETCKSEKEHEEYIEFHVNNLRARNGPVVTPEETA